MGMCMEALDRIQEAYDCYDYALKLSPGDNTVIAYKGDALLKLKNTTMRSTATLKPSAVTTSMKPPSMAWQVPLKKRPML